MSNNKFWKFRNSDNGKTAELLLFGDIASEKSWFGDEITPKEFAEDLSKTGEVDEITVYITSGGGDPFAAQAIGNMLERHSAKVTAHIDGICASAATIVACHCDKVVASEDSTYMIHPVQMGLAGYYDAADLENAVEAISTIRETIVGLYARKTGREVDEVAALMDATSWWTSKQAMENGFIDEIAQDKKKSVVENRSGFLFVNSISTALPFDTAPDFVQAAMTAAPAAHALVDNTDGAEISASAETQHTPKEENTMGEIKTVDELRAAFPELVDQIEQAAAQKAETAERQRIRDIEEMALAGSEAFTDEAKFSNPLSAADYAVAAMKQAKAQGAAYLNGIVEDTKQSGALEVQSETPVPRDSTANMIEQAKADARAFIGSKA